MRIRRWFIYREYGALHIERGADPQCEECGGDGWWWTASSSDPETPDEVLCACMFGPRWRVRYRPRRWCRTARADDAWLSDEAPF